MSVADLTRPPGKLDPSRLPNDVSVEFKLTLKPVSIAPTASLEAAHVSLSCTGTSTLWARGVVRRTGPGALTWNLDPADFGANPLLERYYHMKSTTLTTLDERKRLPNGGCAKRYEEHARVLTMDEIADPTTRWLNPNDTDTHKLALSINFDKFHAGRASWYVLWSFPYVVSGKYLTSDCSPYFHNEEGTTGPTPSFAWWLDGGSGYVAPRFDPRRPTPTSVSFAWHSTRVEDDGPHYWPGYYRQLVMQTCPSYAAGWDSRLFAVDINTSCVVRPIKPEPR